MHGEGEKEVEGIGRRREVGREGGREEKEGGEDKRNAEYVHVYNL